MTRAQWYAQLENEGARRGGATGPGTLGQSSHRCRCGRARPAPLARLVRTLQAFVGSKTEQALLNFCKELKGDYMQIRQARPVPARRAAARGGTRPSHARLTQRGPPRGSRPPGTGACHSPVASFQDVAVEHLYPFSSEKKRSSTIVRHRKGNLRMYTKGASEIVLHFCKRYVSVTPPGALLGQCPSRLRSNGSGH